METKRKWPRVRWPRLRQGPGAALVVALAVAGCVPRLEAPTVELASVRLRGLGLSGGTIDVRLSVRNPNRFALHAEGLTYDLDVLDTTASDELWLDLVSGRYTERVEVGAQDSVVLSIPVDFAYGDLGGALRALLDRGSLRYRVQGRVMLDEPIRRQLRYSHRGDVSLTSAR